MDSLGARVNPSIGKRNRETTLRRKAITLYPLIGWAMVCLQMAWLVLILMVSEPPNPGKVLILIGYTLAITVLAGLWGAHGSGWVRWLGARFARPSHGLSLALFASVFAICFVYALYQRVWPFDEENNLRAARLVYERGIQHLFATYDEIPWLSRWHPPLMPAVLGLAMHLFGPGLLGARLLSVLMGSTTVLLTYRLGSMLYDRQTGITAAILVVAFPLFIRQSAAAMLDIPVTFFLTLSLFLLLHLARTPSYSLAILIGVCIGAGLLTKYLMLLLFPVLLCLFVIRPEFRRLFPHLLVVGIIAGGMLVGWLVYAYQIGVLAQQNEILNAAQPAGAWLDTESGGQQWVMESLLVRLPSALGPYNLPLILFGFVMLIARRERSDQILLAWSIPIAGVLLLTLPDHRYFMLIFPALALMAARAACRQPDGEKLVLLSFAYGVGALYLFVDWFRAGTLFQVQ